MLTGRRVLVTRARSQAAAVCTILESLGAEAVCMPAIEIEPIGDLEPLRRALARTRSGDWLAVTSANAVDAVAKQFLPEGVKIAAVGSATRAALEARGIRVDAMPRRFLGAELAGALGQLRGRRVLLAASDIARDETAEALAAAGAIVERVSVYRTRAADVQPVAGIDAVLLMSPSAVHVARDYRGAVVACIGPTTAAAARDAGLDVAVVPDDHTVPALVAALSQFFAHRNHLAAT